MDWNMLGEKIYAGVLGKIIGVYLGRPVEGWKYEDIQRTFGEINYYVHKQAGVPLIVADDDISGTFGFFRAMEDYGYAKDIRAKEIGETWLNYIIEDKTILWWGGLGRSTEHTAYLNLKNGVEAPFSGSIEKNGRDAAEQIGAQIFIEAFAMCYPGDPQKAVELVHQAASVSHDGMALAAARHLAALDSLAFFEKDINKLLDAAAEYIQDQRLSRIVDDVRNKCAKSNDWRVTREWLNQMYGYHLYPGTCHVAPNHAMVIASLLHGGNDFQKSVMIASSAGWDTDCNAGNVGALNGIRLGLEGIETGSDLRSEVADRLLVVSSDGGAVISDAVNEADKIVKAAKELQGIRKTEDKRRFSFSYAGARQGFMLCPYANSSPLFANISSSDGKNGLCINCNGLGKGIEAAVSTPTFVEFVPEETNYLSTASPTLYEGQTISSTVFVPQSGNLQAKIYIVYDKKGIFNTLGSDYQKLKTGKQNLSWHIPFLHGATIIRAGIMITSATRFSGSIYLLDMDWNNTPTKFEQSGILMKNIWDLFPRELQMWTSSAKNFSVDLVHTFCISHPEFNGLATIGTSDWTDYRVESVLYFGLHTETGLVLRCKGHRQYYGAGFKDGTAELFVMKHGQRIILMQQAFHYKTNKPYKVSFECREDNIRLTVDDTILLEKRDSTYKCGGCGFFVDQGTMLADGFTVETV
ncbi:MAG: ADP-ribosylglycohydrolase family protein [Lachnospiraceae bacterium]|nr:ADP-ribosylglycohydrolase family protein [Lachnospiraceae bacterium]